MFPHTQGNCQHVENNVYIGAAIGIFAAGCAMAGIARSGEERKDNKKGK